MVACLTNLPPSKSLILATLKNMRAKLRQTTVQDMGLKETIGWPDRPSKTVGTYLRISVVWITAYRMSSGTCEALEICS